MTTISAEDLAVIRKKQAWEIVVGIMSGVKTVEAMQADVEREIEWFEAQVEQAQAKKSRAEAIEECALLSARIVVIRENEEEWTDYVGRVRVEIATAIRALSTESETV